MTTRDDVYQAITNSLQKRYSLTHDITGESKIFHDLGLRGMDASEFLTEIFKTYNVDWSGFSFDTYFKGEYYSLVDLLNWLLRQSDDSKRPFTINHLVDVCMKGFWFDPPA